MNHEIVLDLRRVPSVPGAFGFRLTVESRAHVRLALPHPDPQRGLRFESIANGEAREWGLWTLPVTEFRPLILEPGASAVYGWRVWPCDRAERWPWGWLAQGERWCIDLPRSDSPFRATFDFEVGRDFFDLDSHADFRHLVNFAGAAGAEVWEGRIASNRVEFARRL